MGLRHWARDGMLLGSMIVALGLLDARGAFGGLWLALPLGLGAMAAALAGAATPPWEWRQARALGLVGLVLGTRAVASLAGPLPGLGVREAMALGVILTVGAATWTVARADARRVVVLWSLAQLLGCLVEIALAFWSDQAAGKGMGARFIQASSSAGRLAEGLGGMLGTGMLALATGGGGAPRRARAGAAATTAAAAPIRWSLRLAALAAGLAAGLWLSKMSWGLAGEQERALLTGRRALQELWLQSLLVGWGRHAVEPLAQMLAMPRAALFQAWSGPWGLLAMGGLLGVGAMAAACAMLLGLRPARRRRRGAPDGAACIALVVGGLILGGGPMSGATLLVFAGWATLALAAAWRPPFSKLEIRNSKFETQGSSFALESPPARWNVSNLAATGVAMLALAGIATLLAMPARGNRLLAKSQNPRDPVADRIDALSRARSLNPFNPTIPTRLAAVLREQMDQAPAWSESLYLSVIDAYAAAQRLSPYETTVPMTRAQFQVTCKRPEAAMRSIAQALASQPRAADLCDWMFLSSMRLDREQDAWNALERGLRMEPMSRVWWLRQYLLAGARGQRALADRSLCVALTTGLEDPRLVAEAWRLGQGKDASGLPGVRLPVAQPAPSADANAEESF
jgi:hypothetical protein